MQTSELDGLGAAPQLDVPEAAPPLASDRTIPGWVLWVGGAYAFVTYVLVALLAVVTIFFHSIVVADGQTIVSPLLVGISLLAIVGVVVFEFAFARALSGLRYIRGSTALRVQAVAGGLTLFALALVHPVLPLAAIFSAGLGAVSLFALSRIRGHERHWDFLLTEATSVLSGRDMEGWSLAQKPVREHVLAPAFVLAFTLLAFIATYGAGGYLAATDVISHHAVSANALLNAWAVFCIMRGTRSFFKTSPPELRDPANILPTPVADDALPDMGLVVRNLSVTGADRTTLLNNISFSMPPGTLLAVTGDTGAGKSLLLKTLTDPFALETMQVSGLARINNADLWQRKKGAFSVPAVHLPPQPILLPTSGANNLSCFQEGGALHTARRHLEQLTFSSQLADQICAVADATALPDMQKKTLAMARALTIAPSLYLFDRPEDGLPEKQVAMFLSKLKNETRLGRVAIIVTENRKLLEACDKIMVMQNGRVVDFGSSDDIRTRRDAGWARFVGQRTLEIEENLENWIRSHFKRPGDEANRRRAAMLASEMLALSCQGTHGHAPTDALVFEFKHFVGHCLLRMQDGDAPLTSAQISRAREELQRQGQGTRLSPLATILGTAAEIETNADFEQRLLTVKFETYDPRSGGALRQDASAHS